MKFNSSPGQWSAFWLTSPIYDTGVGNPGLYGTEIDIVEHRAVNNNDNRPSVDRYVSAVHWDGYGADHQQTAQTHGHAAPRSATAAGTPTPCTGRPAGYEFYFDDTLHLDRHAGRSPPGPST